MTPLQISFMTLSNPQAMQAMLQVGALYMMLGVLFLYLSISSTLTLILCFYSCSLDFKESHGTKYDAQ